MGRGTARRVVEGPLRHAAASLWRATSPSQVDGEEQVGRVHINPDQYFDNVPALAWEFHIGGYQPAQKWLKDRKGRALSFDDALHYQKIIKILEPKAGNAKTSSG